ncbi:MAG: ROK family protein [Actinomycetia bacterium]|nr:ROK family protein [Actinomycetes bacterium]MCP4959688.1 ROK family protein [Actinomycetes bacterium]
MTNTGFTAGIDVGGTKCLAVIIDPDNNIVAESRVPTPRGATALIDMVEAVAVELIELSGGLDGIGVGVPGQMDLSGRMAFAPNLDLGDLPIQQLLEDRLEVEIVIDNEANCAAAAELQLGVARGVSDAVLITLGTGFGNAIIVNGDVSRGAFGMAGELGHTVVNPSGPECGCGNRGCLECYASGSGLQWMAREAVERGETTRLLALAGGDIENVRGEHVTRAARDGDKAAIGVIDRFSWWLALGLANAVAILDPEMVILGGGLVTDWDLFEGRVRSHYDKMVLAGPYRPPLRIEPVALGERAGALGAALSARVHKGFAN